MGAARLSTKLSISPKKYREHMITVYYKVVSSMPFIGPRGTYFGKLQELLLKPAKVDVC
jgi:hypothetical protein